MFCFDFCFSIACSKSSVSGELKKRAGDELGLGPLLFSPGSRSPLIPLVARSLFRSFSLTESLEQATNNLIFSAQIIGLIQAFKYEQNYMVLSKLTAKFLLNFV